MFVMDEILFLPIVIYVPALAFSQVTGVNLYLVGLVICIVCVFYTIIGGIRAVVATDAWQVMVMFVAVVVVACLGTSYIGGPLEVFKRAKEGGRLIFFEYDQCLLDFTNDIIIFLFLIEWIPHSSRGKPSTVS